MPSIRFTTSKYYTCVIASILSLSNIMPIYSHCVKKGLVYIIIAAPSSRQPLSYAKYTKANMRSSCDICSISNAKYMCYLILCSLLVLCLIYLRVLNLNCC